MCVCVSIHSDLSSIRARFKIKFLVKCLAKQSILSAIHVGFPAPRWGGQHTHMHTHTHMSTHTCHACYNVNRERNQSRHKREREREKKKKTRRDETRRLYKAIKMQLTLFHSLSIYPIYVCYAYFRFPEMAGSMAEKGGGGRDWSKLKQKSMAVKTEVIFQPCIMK